MIKIKLEGEKILEIVFSSAPSFKPFNIWNLISTSLTQFNFTTEQIFFNGEREIKSQKL